VSRDAVGFKYTIVPVRIGIAAISGRPGLLDVHLRAMVCVNMLEPKTSDCLERITTGSLGEATLALAAASNVATLEQANEWSGWSAGSVGCAIR
jgi:hypothetical protein